MSVLNEEDSRAVDHITKAIQDSHELEPIIRLFKVYPELEKIRQRELAADGENCYGPWLGGEYYHVALAKVLAEWDSGKKSATQEFSEELQQQIADLKKENYELKKHNEAMADYFIRMIMNVGNRAELFGERFTEYLETWVQNKAKGIQEKKGEKKD